MKLIVLLFFCQFSITYSTANLVNENLKLELVQVVFRHGARTPVQLELDVCNYTAASAYEPWGLGELNNEGKRQEYGLGLFLRNRYADFLRPTYKPDDVYAYASEVSRAKMSLELILAGLYPPVGRMVWNEFLLWSPIPYRYTPRKLDILLRAYENPKFMRLYMQVVNSDEFKRKLAKYTDFFKYVKDKTAAKENDTLAIAVKTFDVLIANEYMKLPLPEWYTPKVRQIFIEIMVLVWDSFAATTEMKRLGIGPLIKTFIENMNLNETSKGFRQIFLYGGHDENVAMFTRAHNIQEFRYPFFGSALIFEKLRDSKNQVYVRLFAWNGLGKLTALKLGDNKGLCPIDEYLELVKPVIPSEMELNEMIGNLNSTEVKNLFFNNKLNNYG